MKKTICLLLGVFFLNSIIIAQAPKLPVDKGTSFGEKTTVQGAIATDEVAALLKNKESVEIKVKGEVADVCHAKGCFLYLKTSTGKIYIKTKDDAFFVPVALQGKTVVVKGIASIDKESKEVSIQATGVLVI